MKNIIKKISILLMMICVLVCSSCFLQNEQPTDTPSTDVVTYTYELSDETVSLEVGQTKQLSVTVSPEKELTVLYESSDDAIATVSEDGLVTAVSEGSATITVTVDEEVLTCEVTVSLAPIVYEYELSATTLTNGCYYLMFRGCSKLNYVKCLATDISADACITQWLINVAPSGTFVKASSMSDWATGVNIPDGWTVQNA